MMQIVVLRVAEDKSKSECKAERFTSPPPSRMTIVRITIHRLAGTVLI